MLTPRLPAPLQVKAVNGSSILRILKTQGLAPDIPEDLYHLIKKVRAAVGAFAIWHVTVLRLPSLVSYKPHLPAASAEQCSISVRSRVSLSDAANHVSQCG